MLHIQIDPAVVDDSQRGFGSLHIDWILRLRLGHGYFSAAAAGRVHFPVIVKNTPFLRHMFRRSVPGPYAVAHRLYGLRDLHLVEQLDKLDLLLVINTANSILSDILLCFPSFLMYYAVRFLNILGCFSSPPLPCSNMVKNDISFVIHIFGRYAPVDSTARSYLVCLKDTY